MKSWGFVKSEKSELLWNSFFSIFLIPPKKSIFGGDVCSISGPLKKWVFGGPKGRYWGPYRGEKKSPVPPKTRVWGTFSGLGHFSGYPGLEGLEDPPCKKMARCRFPASGPKPGFLSETKKCASRFFHTVLILKEKNYTRRKKIL